MHKAGVNIFLIKPANNSLISLYESGADKVVHMLQ